MIDLPEQVGSRKRRRAQVELGLGQVSNSASLPREVTRIIRRSSDQSTPSCSSAVILTIARYSGERHGAAGSAQLLVLMKEMCLDRSSSPQAQQREGQEQPVHPEMVARTDSAATPGRWRVLDELGTTKVLASITS
jgi:hypothetical protein